MQGGILYIKPYFEIGASASVNETPTALTTSGFTPIFTTPAGQQIGGTFLLASSNNQPLSLGVSLLNDSKNTLLSTLNAFNTNQISRTDAILQLDRQSLQIATICLNTASSC